MSVQIPTVRVYRNLHRNCLSIQAKTATGWRVVAHAISVELEGVTFKVSQAGRDQVLRTGKKAVHAFAVGRLTGFIGRLNVRVDDPLAPVLLSLPPADMVVPADRVPVSYNPRRQDSFYLVTGSHDREPALRGCASLRMQPTRLMALAPELAIL